MDNTPTFVIGDVHGHYDRMLALLSQEGIVDSKSEKRVDSKVRVIQLGDLCHFGETGSPTGDLFCLQKADEWLDLMLWGNHDRAVIDPYHSFTGFLYPKEEKVKLLDGLLSKGKLKFATYGHGFVICHAGIHRRWDHEYKDVESLLWSANHGPDGKLVRSVGYSRGGSRPEGGILWMDWRREKHSKKFKYICGHTSLGQNYPPASMSDDIQPEIDDYGNWNIDIGTKTNGRLAGIWLPSQKVVSVNLNKLDITEKYMSESNV